MGLVALRARYEFFMLYGEECGIYFVILMHCTKGKRVRSREEEVWVLLRVEERPFGLGSQRATDLLLTCSR